VRSSLGESTRCRFVLRGLISGIYLLVGITTLQAQSTRGGARLSSGLRGAFEIVDPWGNLTAQVESNRDNLLFRLRGGERRQYNREPMYDSRDGDYLGYSNLELNRALRLPASGWGTPWVANLGDEFPRFQPLQQTMRPAGDAMPRPPQLPGWQNPGRPTPGWPGVEPVPPYPEVLFPSPGYPILDFPFLPGGVMPGFQPPLRSVLLESRLIPHPPLPPARLQLFNSSRRTLQVAIIDSVAAGGSRSLRIEGGSAAEVELARESGATRVSRYQTFDALGYPIEREVVTEIPPVQRYEMVVHEWAMQSVAIDRTGKSPNVIEDINMQGRGLGRFPLPPGDALQSGTIDVYQAALNAGNQGAIAPLVPADRGGPNQPSDNANILEDAVLEAQRRAMSGRRP